MEFALTDEQQELARTVRALLAKQADSRAVRQAMASEQGYDASLWQTLCEQVGVTALVVPEEQDGVGASLMETAVVLEEVGYSLAPTPLLATTIATVAVLLHGSDDARADLLPRLAAGSPGTLVWDAPAGPDLVLDADGAEVLLALDGGALSLLPDDVTIEPRPALDPALRFARVGLGSAGTRVGTVDDDRPLRDVAAALATAVQVGVAHRGLDMSVAYAKERVQFGRPIGSFQALKHRMADMLVLVEMARSASWAASGAAAAYVADPTPERAEGLRLRAAAAQAYCSDAAERVAGETIQLHGGIAITWEHDAHLVLKRAHALGQLFGPAHRHRAILLDL
jgi:alkylation response protein AidB-like acyl-CoA dehydrogenase